MRVDWVIVDPNNDFCASGNEPDDFPQPFGGKRAGALHVTGADVEATRVGKSIKKNLRKIAKLHVTLDKHHPNDCAHNTAWKGPDGKSPPPFTLVTHDDVKQQKWIPRFEIGVFQGKTMPSYQWALKYTEALEKTGRIVLCLWPEHCLIDSWGACAYWPIQEACDEWEAKRGGWINWISKGQWPFTEHYSALRAEVVDDTRPETQLNIDFLKDVSNSDLVIWTGWAGSHCLKSTALDAVNYFGAGENQFLKKSIFISDACAAVPNPGPGGPDFQQWRLDFLDEVKTRGARVMTLDELDTVLN